MQEEADFERLMSFNLGPMNSLDAEQEVCGPNMLHPLGQVRVVLLPSLYWGSNPLGTEVDAAFSKAGTRSLRLLGPCRWHPLTCRPRKGAVLGVVPRSCMHGVGGQVRGRMEEVAGGRQVGLG